MKTFRLVFPKAIEVVAQLNVEFCSKCKQNSMVFDYMREGFVCSGGNTGCLNQVSLDDALKGKKG